MGYVGIEIEGAGALVDDLRTGARSLDDARSLVADAAFLADLSMPCVLALDDIINDLDQLANRIEWAVTKVVEFKMTLHGLVEWSVIPQPIRTPVPEADPLTSAPTSAIIEQRSAVQWNAHPDSALEDVVQVASHNSYAVDGGIAALYGLGVRAFELDIHRAPPLHVSLGRTGDSGAPGWQVYHVLGWSHREYETLSQGLAAVASLGSIEPVTLFIDNKDEFNSAHSADAFDQVLRHELGDMLFTPADLLKGSTGSTSLLEAVQRNGWPTIDELEGRVIVVLTDRIDGYRGDDRLAFVAAPPSFTVDVGETIHQSHADVVFYNADARAISPLEIRAVNASGALVRTYFNPLCVEQVIGQEPAEAHYRAVDVALDGSICEPRVIVLPTPVPGPN